MQQHNPVSSNMYKALTRQELVVMLSLERFDNGAVFTDEIYKPEYSGFWFSNKELLLQNMGHEACNLEHASYAITNDKEFMLAAIRIDMHSAQYLSDTLRNDKDIFIKTIRGKQHYTVGDELSNDSAFLLYLVQNPLIIDIFGCFNRFNSRVKDDKELFIKLIKVMPFIIKYASPRLCDDRELINLAINSTINLKMHYDINGVPRHGDLIWRCLSSKLRKDIDLLVSLICTFNKTFQFQYVISNSTIRESHYLTCLAVEHCDPTTINLQLISPKFRNDPAVLLMICNIQPDRIAITLTNTPFFISNYSAPSLLVCLCLRGW